MQKRIIFFFICFFISQPIIPQSSFYLYNASHYARVIRLGGVYTGVAEGPEALFYNASGIAFENSYSFLVSRGQGFAVFVENQNYDLAFVIPYSDYGNFGFSVNTLSIKLPGMNIENIYSLSYGRKILNNLALGIALNYYHSEIGDIYITGPDSPDGYMSDISAGAFDVNLSALYLFTPDFSLTDRDKFKAGFQIKNILNTKISFQDKLLMDDIPGQDKFQNMRIGLSYSYVPFGEKFSGFYPLIFMTAFDAVFIGSNYDFDRWQPNYGLELTLLELLNISFGRENEIQIKESYIYSPQHPVNRYGAGITIPFNKIFDLSYPAELKLNYSISDWQKLDENAEYSIYYGVSQKIKNKAFSGSLRIGF